MKLLPLESTYRGWLNSRAALAFDSDLNEKFIGLTHSESLFFAEMSRGPLLPLESRDVEDLERFIWLYNRHEFTLALHHNTHSCEATY
jgi:hypothetical protein